MLGRRVWPWILYSSLLGDSWVVSLCIRRVLVYVGTNYTYLLLTLVIETHKSDIGLP